MSDQMASKRRGRTLVEEDPDSDWRQSALCGVIEDDADLIQRDALKPFDEVEDGCAVFKVLEQG